MTYELTDKRSPTSAVELTETQREQLVLAWRFYSGEEEAADALVADNPGWFQLWSVLRDGQPAFDYWHLPPDSGTLFYAGQATPTGIRMIQFGWDVVDEPPTPPDVDLESLAQELDTAWRARRDP